MPNLSPVINFGEWLPDLPDNNNPGTTVATNVIPAAGFYRPLQSIQPNTNALPQRCQGIFSVFDATGTVFTFAGTQNDLFLLESGSWTNKTRTTGGNYNTPDDQTWSFTIFGNFVIATNFVDDIQFFDITAPSGNFEKLITSTSETRARRVTVINNFLATVNTEDTTDGIRRNRVRWSAINNPRDFDISPTTLSDFQDLEGEGGAINGIIGLQNYGLILQEKAIWRMEFIGSPLAFSFQKMEENRGTRIPASVVANGAQVFWLGEDGFYMFDGQRSVPIGDNRVDEFFFRDASPVDIVRVTASIDPVNKIVAWSYISTSSPNGEPDRVIFFNWAQNRWSLGNVALQILAESLTSSTTLEGLDAFYSSLEEIPYSLDSSIWQGGNTFLVGVTPDGRFGAFAGANLDATIETSEAKLNTMGRTFVTSVLPVTDCETVTAQVGSRDRQFGTVSFTPEIAPETTTEECNFLVDGRYFRFRVNLTGNWQTAQGVQVRGEISGLL